MWVLKSGFEWGRRHFELSYPLEMHIYFKPRRRWWVSMGSVGRWWLNRHKHRDEFDAVVVTTLARDESSCARRAMDADLAP